MPRPASPFPSDSSGASGSTTTASRTRRRVSAPMRASPAAALCSSLAATLTASPVTSVSPSPPTTTSPVLTPNRASSSWAAITSRISPGRADSAKRVVLVCRRGPEDRHHRITDELLDRATVTLEDRPQILEVATHARADHLGIRGLAERGRADEVAEEHRDDLALLARRAGTRELRPA